MKKRIILGFISCMVFMLSQAQDKLIFTPQWTAQAQFAGYYVAQASTALMTFVLIVSALALSLLLIQYSTLMA